MLTNWDYATIVIYFILMIVIGIICKHLNKDSSDYFRGGGDMLWWISGMSAMAVGFSAYSFTAASAKVYETGLLLFLIYFIGVIVYIPLYFWLAERFRQSRAVTSADAIRRRYGKVTEQFWVWTSLPLGLFNGGMSLYIISLFVSAALGIDIHIAMLVLTVVVTLMAVAGGAWAVAVSDFIQMVLVIVMSCLVSIRCLMLPELGGASTLFEKLPEHFTNFDLFERPAIWIGLLVMFAISNFIRGMDLNAQGAKYLTAKNGAHAKRSVLIQIVGNILLPIVAFTPILVAGAIDMDLASIFPDLPNPSEGAYVAIAAKVLPNGMLGLIICAIFAATMSTMDTALNRNAGFFVKNFYGEFIRPKATEQELLRTGQAFTLLFGVIVFFIAILIGKNRDQDLFSWLLKLNVLLIFPMVIPMAMAVFVKRTPGWSAWSTVLVGFATAWGVQNHVSSETMASFLGMELPLNDLESKDLMFMCSGSLTLIACFAWYSMTALFYRFTTPAYREEVDDFFVDLRTPIEDKGEEGAELDREQYRIMGLITLIFAAVFACGVLIPNTFMDRMMFVGCALIMALFGYILRRGSKVAKKD